MSAVTSTVRLPWNEAKWVFLLKSPIPFEKDPSLWNYYDFFGAVKRWQDALENSLGRDNIVKDAVTITVSIALSADDTMDLIIEFIVADAKDERSTLFVRAAKKWCRIVTKMACNWRRIIESTNNNEDYEGTDTHQDGDDRRETVVALNRIASAPPIIVSSTALDAAPGSAKEPSV